MAKNCRFVSVKIILIFLVVITIITLVGSLKFIMEYRNGSETVRPIKPPPASTQNPPENSDIDISDWKKYESGDFGFEIAYPADISLDGPDLIDLSNTIQLSSIDFYGHTEAEPVFITVEVYERPEDITRESIYSLDYHADLLALQKKDGLQEALSAANSRKEGVVYDVSNPEKNISQRGEVNGPRLSYLTNILTKDSRYEYMIGISLPLNEKGMNEEILKNISETLRHYIDVYNKMLESFKITSEMPPNISWETWKWDKECGNFEVRYPPGWKVNKINSDRLGCTSDLSYLPMGDSSLASATKGVALNFNYSATSTSMETDCSKTEKVFANFPERSYSAGNFHCTREENSVNNEDSLSFGCCARSNRSDKGILFVGGNMLGNYKEEYVTRFNQILSSFKFTEE